MAPTPAAEQPLPAVIEEKLLTRVIGQEAAAKELMRCYTRYRAGLAPINRPAGIFLMLGPTGSGKTHLARQFGVAVTGSLEAPLRIDCGEYTQGHEVAKLLGAPPGYLGHRETPAMLRQSNLSAQHTSDSRLSVVLFDEIDKAHPKLWDLLLSIFDTGKLTLGDNSTVDFTQSIILLTGNTGAKAIAENAKPSWGFLAGNPNTTADAPKHAELAAKRLLRPEMFNRLDKVLTFNQLGTESLRAILTLELEDLQGRLASRGISLTLTEPVRELLLTDGQDPRYGARHLKRAITKHIELPLADAIVTGDIPDGSQVKAQIRSGEVDLRTE